MAELVKVCVDAMGGDNAPGEIVKGAVDALNESEKILEETGIDVSSCRDAYAFTYHRENPGEGDNYFVDVYRFELEFDEADVHPQEEETDGFMLATVDEIAELGRQGVFLHYDSIKQVFH